MVNAEITYPYLLYGGSAGILIDYDCVYDTAFVIGGDGVILYRGIYHHANVRAAIEMGISELDPTPIETETWGGVKALFR